MTVVYRGEGDLPGEDLYSEVLVNEQLQRERGRQAINASDSDRVKVSGSCVNTTHMRVGKVVSISIGDSQKNGYLTDYSKNVAISGSQFTANSSIVVEQIK